MVKIKEHLRTVVQVCFTAFTNGYAQGFAKGGIYKGPTKAVCVPGLNCYSCPGALGACPIGALQAVLGSHKFQFSFYVLGLLMMFGALCGRLVCGWLCPFGLIQDLLHKIPFPRKLKKLPGERWLRRLRFVVLAVLVVLMPLFVVDMVGQGAPWFCKLVCPSGTLTAGIPLVLANRTLRSVLGWLYAWKVALLLAVLLLSVVLWRPFCRYLCPLGAIYAPFNKFALYRYRVNTGACTRCGVCQKACQMDIPVWKEPNSLDCVRCGACKKACPHHALTSTFEKGSAINDEQ